MAKWNSLMETTVNMKHSKKIRKEIFRRFNEITFVDKIYQLDNNIFICAELLRGYLA